jgi:hypothetical protein|tara:strand:- start:374 stop:520 length:147 start_codon:yes stop_codon:yes gene_type:complete
MIKITEQELKQIKDLAESIRFTEDNTKDGCGCTTYLERVEALIEKLKQ